MFRDPVGLALQSNRIIGSFIQFWAPLYKKVTRQGAGACPEKGNKAG